MLSTLQEDPNETPCISELRHVDCKYLESCVWEVEAPPPAAPVQVQTNTKKRPPRKPHVIKFGSSTDCMVHAVCRIVVLIDLMLVPFVISFEYVYPLHNCVVVHMIDGFSTFVFAICVMQQFWTSYIDPKEMVEVKDPATIQLTVLCSYSFVADVVSICAVPALYTHTHFRALACLRLVKCRRLMRDRARTMLLEDGTSILPKLAQIVLVVYGCMHLYACAWFKAKVCSPRGLGREWSAWNGWSRDVFDEHNVNQDSFSIPIEPGDSMDLLLCYCRALRDGTYMVVTWGGPNSLSFVELGTLVVMGPLLSCVMAYIYGYIVQIIGNATTMQDRLSKQMHVLNAACLDMRVPTSLRLRVCRYHSYKQAHHMDGDAQALFTQLSPNLNSEARVHRMRHIILSSDVFQGLTARLVLILLSTSTEHLYSPGDLVVRKGEIADCMYIVMRGVLSVTVGKDADVVVKKLHVSQMFGEACFIGNNQPRLAWVRAETFSVLSRFDRDSFDHVMESHQELKAAIRDAIVRTINKYKKSDNAKTSIIAASKGLPDPLDTATFEHPGQADAHQVPEVQKAPDADSEVPRPTIAMHDVMSKVVDTHGRFTKRKTNSGVSGSSLALAPLAKSLSNGAKSGDECDPDSENLPLKNEFVHKTASMSMDVYSTAAFRVSVRNNSSSNGFQLDGATQQSPGVALAEQSEAQRMASQHLAKLSIGRAIQREAVSFLKEQTSAVVSECSGILSRECEALLGHLASMEVAQQRLRSMISSKA